MGHIGPADARGLSMPMWPGCGADDMHITYSPCHPPAWRIYNISPATACIRPGLSLYLTPAGSDAAAARYL